ncbi:Sec-independent protein translocase subunit TatA/TatB [Selenomonas dianae]|uniref:Sec-independent protein translocase protein TatA n=1 Tax=Selenomonas dianae TaxID=135079 RepID=A0ABN0T344_9FIRM|nr:twin-arginine translocase TatA/TatE family subunit [Selenomonas dianae]WLD82067.1 twin-arginine translocase TatA/TatE family subunit [Selenomonas dianae]
MFGLGVPELVLILIIGLVVFGPGRLPDIGKALGKSIKEFKSANNEKDDARAEINVTEEAKRLPESEKKEAKS